MFQHDRPADHRAPWGRASRSDLWPEIERAAQAVPRVRIKSKLPAMIEIVGIDQNDFHHAIFVNGQLHMAAPNSEATFAVVRRLAEVLGATVKIDVSNKPRR